MLLKALPAPTLRKALAAFLLVVLAVLALHSLGESDSGVKPAKAALEASAARAEVFTAQAAEARKTTKPALARAESVHARVKVVAPGVLRVQDGTPTETTLVRVPPLVTDRIQADSTAISALSVALMWDSTAIAAEVKARGAADLTIKTLEREGKPRCGWRCGLLLGAASVVALGIAIH
jgi:hypothetical protein